MQINSSPATVGDGTRKGWRGAMIGMVMGDGSLWRQKNRHGDHHGNYVMGISHCARQAEYLEHKKKIVNEIFQYQIPTRRFMATYHGGVSEQVRFSTRVHPRFKIIGDNIYIAGKKRISDWVLDNITDEGMAYWWMDDGCLRKRHSGRTGGESILAVNGFLLEDVEKLCAWINNRYGSSFRIYKHVSCGYAIRRGVSGTINFLDALRKYSVTPMEYKFEYEKCFSKRKPYAISA